MSQKTTHFDYKDIDTIKKHLDAYGRIIPKRYNDLTAREQRDLARAVKYARFIGLLPFIAR